jgi:hypothetical protein
MRGAIIVALLSLICSAFGQDVKADAEKDGQDLAQQMVAKLRGISPAESFGIIDKEYAKHVDLNTQITTRANSCNFLADFRFLSEKREIPSLAEGRLSFKRALIRNWAA